MAYLVTLFSRRRLGFLAWAVGLTLFGCSGGGGGTGPSQDPVQDPPVHHPPVQDPPAQDPPQQPPPEQPAGIAGTYALIQINNSKPGQLVTISNPDGNVAGLYRFDAGTELTLDELQTFTLRFQYTDDKEPLGFDDEGEFKQVGSSGGTLALAFTSTTYDDAFSGVAVDGVVSFKYDFDGDGQTDTVFAFQRVGS